MSGSGEKLKVDKSGIAAAAAVGGAEGAAVVAAAAAVAAKDALAAGVATVVESCVVHDRVSGVAWSREGGRFAVLTGRTLQVFSLYSGQHGGLPGRVHVLAGHAGDIGAFSLSDDWGEVFTAGKAEGVLYRWGGLGTRKALGRVLSPVEELSWPGVTFSALCAGADGGLVAAAVEKSPALDGAKRDRGGGGKQGERCAGDPASAAFASINSEGSVDDGSLDSRGVGGGGGGRGGGGNRGGGGGRHGPGGGAFAAPSSLARSKSFAVGGREGGEGDDDLGSGLASPGSPGSGLHAVRAASRFKQGPSRGASVREAESLRLATLSPEQLARERKLAGDAWDDSHASLAWWPTGCVEQGRVEVKLAPGLGCLTSLALVHGGLQGRSGCPSVLLAGGNKGCLVALPWPLDQSSSSCSSSSSSEPSSFAPSAPPPSTALRCLSLGEAASLALPPARSARDRAASAPKRPGMLAAAPLPSEFPVTPSVAVPLAACAHAGPVRFLAVAPEGDLVITASGGAGGDDCGGFFVHALMRKGSGGASRLSYKAAADVRLNAPPGCLADGDVRVAEGKALAEAAARERLLLRRIAEAKANLTFQKAAWDKQVKARVATLKWTMTMELGKKDRELKQLRAAKASEAKQASDSSLAAELEFGQAADEMVSLYENKLVEAAAKVQALSERADALKLANEAAESAHGVALGAAEAAHAEHLAGERARLAEERAVMRRYVEYVRAKYDAVMDDEDARHDAEVAKLAGAAAEEHRLQVASAEAGRMERAGFERKQARLSEALFLAQEQANALREAAQGKDALLDEMRATLASREAGLARATEKSGAWEAAAAKQVIIGDVLCKGSTKTKPLARSFILFLSSRCAASTTTLRITICCLPLSLLLSSSSSSSSSFTTLGGGAGAPRGGTARA